MPKHKSNEWEFQGQVLTWINEQISRRPGLGLDKATQEPSKITPKRSDLVIWWNRAANNAFFTVELKTPEVPINDPKLLNDASEKATRWEAPCFAIWNMQMAELYKTPKKGTATPANRVQTPNQPTGLLQNNHQTKFKTSISGSCRRWIRRSRWNDSMPTWSQL